MAVPLATTRSQRVAVVAGVALRTGRQRQRMPLPWWLVALTATAVSTAAVGTVFGEDTGTAAAVAVVSGAACTVQAAWERVRPWVGDRAAARVDDLVDELLRRADDGDLEAQRALVELAAVRECWAFNSLVPALSMFGGYPDPGEHPVEVALARAEVVARTLTPRRTGRRHRRVAAAVADLLAACPDVAVLDVQDFLCRDDPPAGRRPPVRGTARARSARLRALLAADAASPGVLNAVAGRGGLDLDDAVTLAHRLAASAASAVPVVAAPAPPSAPPPRRP